MVMRAKQHMNASGDENHLLWSPPGTSLETEMHILKQRPQQSDIPAVPTIAQLPINSQQEGFPAILLGFGGAGGFGGAIVGTIIGLILTEAVDGMWEPNVQNQMTSKGHTYFFSALGGSIALGLLVGMFIGFQERRELAATNAMMRTTSASHGKPAPSPSLSPSRSS
jgi:hypothetical protein